MFSYNLTLLKTFSTDHQRVPFLPVHYFSRNVTVFLEPFELLRHLYSLTFFNRSLLKNLMGFTVDLSQPKIPCYGNRRWCKLVTFAGLKQDNVTVIMVTWTISWWYRMPPRYLDSFTIPRDFSMKTDTFQVYFGLSVQLRVPDFWIVVNIKLRTDSVSYRIMRMITCEALTVAELVIWACVTDHAI